MPTLTILAATMKGGGRMVPAEPDNTGQPLRILAATMYGGGRMLAPAYVNPTVKAAMASRVQKLG